MSNPIDTFSDFGSINQMRRLNEQFAEHSRQVAKDQFHRDNPVILIGESIRKYVQEFEARLDAEHEVGVRLVSFGNVVVFHAEQIEFSRPHLVTFSGTTPEGEHVQLIQHVSQLSFLLKAVPKLGKEPRRIGFV